MNGLSDRSYFGDVAEGVARILPDIFVGGDEIGDERTGVYFLLVGETENKGLRLSVDVVVNINCIGKIVVDEAVALTIDDTIVLISLLLTQHNVLK